MNKRDKMWVKLRHKIVFALLRPFFAVFLFIKYGYRFTKWKCSLKKPYLILSNHITTLDPFMVALSFNIPLYYIAGDDLFSFKFFSPIIKYLVAPIPKTKSASDFQTIRDCYKIAAQGGSICVFPEGNRVYNGVTTHIPFSIVKLVRMLKLPLLLYKIEGGFGVQPRWAKDIRRGKMFGGVYRALSYDEYKLMSDDSLYSYIKDNLYSNAFNEAQISKNLYKSKYRAEYLERFLYACPQCLSFSTLKSNGTQILCNKCGLDVVYGENLLLKTIKGKCEFENLKEWDDFQKDLIRIYNLDNFNTEHPIFIENEVLLKQTIRAKRKIVIGSGKLILFKDRLEIEINSNKHIFYINDITSVAIFGKNRIQFYHKDNIFQILGSVRFNALKYLNMYHHIKNKIEGTSDEFLGL